MEYLLPLVNCIIFISLSCLHIYWLLGGKWALNAAIPTDSNGRRLFQAGPFATFLVALGLAGFAWVNMVHAGWIKTGLSDATIRYAMMGIAIIFLLRSIGDLNYIGFLKRHRQSQFAKWDTVLYSPLCFLLALFHFWISLFS